MNTDKHRSKRKRRDNGKHDGVIMPVPASSVELPEDYAVYCQPSKSGFRLSD